MKWWFLASIFLVMILPASGQKQRLRGGISFGGNVSMFDAENVFSKKMGYQTGNYHSFHGGFFLEIPAGKNLQIQPEILYSIAGYRWYYNPDLTYAEYQNDPREHNALEYLEFISIPVLVKYNIKGFGIYAGPQANILPGVTRKEEKRSYYADGDYKTGLGISAVAGIEYMFQFGLGLNVRYAMSGNISQGNTADDIYEPHQEVRPKILMYGIHWRFQRKKK